MQKGAYRRGYSAECKRVLKKRLLSGTQKGAYRRKHGRQGRYLEIEENMDREKLKRIYNKSFPNDYYRSSRHFLFDGKMDLSGRKNACLVHQY